MEAFSRCSVNGPLLHTGLLATHEDTMDGGPLYTGFVTNGVTGAVLYFDNGFCKGSPEEE